MTYDIQKYIIITFHVFLSIIYFSIFAQLFIFVKENDFLIFIVCNKMSFQ